jgi:hypothetical protein
VLLYVRPGGRSPLVTSGDLGETLGAKTWIP